jgi:hypothetical protein
MTLLRVESYGLQPKPDYADYADYADYGEDYGASLLNTFNSPSALVNNEAPFVWTAHVNTNLA